MFRYLTLASWNVEQFHRVLAASVTQRDKLQSGVFSLRPGIPATIRCEDATHVFLLLYMKANDKPCSWGLRNDMTMHILRLKRTLQKKAPAPASSPRAFHSLN